jgi:hypothetical protein
MTRTTKTKPSVGTSADFGAIADDLVTLRRDFAALMVQIKPGASNGANGTVKKTLDQLGDTANHLYDNLATQGGRSAKAISRQVEEQPVISLLIAFSVGFIASRLLIR